MNEPRILIVGVGRIGEALAKTIASKQLAEIALFDSDAAKISHQVPLPDLVPNAQYVFLCIPAAAAAEVVDSCRDCLLPEVIVVSLIKGLDPESGQTMAELLRKRLPPHAKLAILGGPVLSGELQQGRAAFGVVATEAAAFVKLAALFGPTLLNIEYSTDVAGVCAAGVLKNIYALGLGIAEALGVGDNARGMLVALALLEMREQLPAFGGQLATIDGLAGVGDLVATGLSVHSRNRTAGEELVRTGSVTTPSEGLLTLPIFMRWHKPPPHLAFIHTINAVVQERADARASFQKLLAVRA